MRLHTELVFIVIVLGHILGDFYFQSEKMANDKKENYLAVFWHSLTYALSISVTILLCIPHESNLMGLILSVSLCHFLIDTIKFFIEKNPKIKPANSQASTSDQPKSIRSILYNNLFLVDQAVHFLSLIFCWYCFGRDIDVRWFLSAEVTHLPHLPIIMLLGFLFVGKPVGIWIGKSNLRNYLPSGADNTSPTGSGKVIGYLERMIVLVFLMYGQYGSIAFVLTAKSVARFKEIEANRGLAEYYLIGTLMSVGSAMLIAMLLGLTP